MKFLAMSVILVTVVSTGTAKKTPKPIIPSCQIKWQDFQDKILDRYWITLYKADFRSDASGESGNTMTVHSVYNQDTYRLLVSHWEKQFGSDEFECDGHDSPNYIRADDNYVFLQRRSVYTISFKYMSRNASQYIINSACFGPLDEDGICPEPIIYVMVPDARGDSDSDGAPDGPLKLTGTPWGAIDKDLKDCIGVSFEDTTEPLLKWVWDGQDCPFPVSK